MKTYFGEMLKSLRMENGVNQVALAQHLNDSKGIISLWENSLREPIMTNLIAIARYFNVSIDYLVGLSDS